MPYITPGDRHQIQMITLDSMLEPESEIRIIDAFVNALDLNKLGFARTVPAKEHRLLPWRIYPAEVLRNPERTDPFYEQTGLQTLSEQEKMP